MCGIAGYVGPRCIEPEAAAACLRLLRHRGPDAEGTWRARVGGDRHLLLLHRRLSVIDLDPRANQPMAAGGAVLIHNGEVYNFQELRARRGWTDGALRTRSDTEVLLRLLAERGWRGLDECEGMWALAWFDEATGVMLLARDRFGEKPLHLMEDGAGGLYFASEVKALAALCGRRCAVDLNHLRRYMVNGYKSLYKGESSFFQGIRQLEPGTALEIGPDGRRRRHRYWRPECCPEESTEPAEAARQVREALIESVDLRLRADVPVAFLLSGGVDSNALAAVAARVLGRDVHAFTIENSDPRYAETELVRHAVERLGIRHTSLPLEGADLLRDLPRLVRQHDGPVYTITYYVHWLLLGRVAESGHRVTVSGTGADELFSGYFDHHLAYLYEVRNDPALHRRALQAWTRCVRPHVRNPWLQDPDLFINDPGFRGHLYFDADAFAACLVQPWSEPFTEGRYGPGLLRNRMLNELFHEAVPPILHQDDLNAMSHSLENRSPFLDRRLFDVCQRIPTRHLVRDGRAKAVLRDAMRGIVPDRILDEPRKVGFNAPIADLIDVRSPDVRRALLADGPVFELVRRDAVAALLEEPHLPNSRSKFLFNFVNARVFLDEFAS